MAGPHATEHLQLLPVAGPTADRLTLTPPGPLTIGRLAQHSLVLADPVSRHHAMLVMQQGDEGPGWFIVDTASKHGTKLNGTALEPGQRYPLQVGDYIEITKWMFRVADPSSREAEGTIVSTVDDSAEAAPSIRPIAAGIDPDRALHRLSLVLECAEAIHTARDEQHLAEAVLDAAVRGTGFANAAFLRPLGSEHEVSIVSHRGDILADPARPRLSRSLIKQAATGQPVRLTGRLEQSVPGASIIALGIDEAICAPIMLGSGPVGFVYLDSRHSDARQSIATKHAAEFALGIARLAAMALANLMRLDLERRTARVEAELAATAEAQRLVMPRQCVNHGPLRIMGRNRAGQTVSGDFHDVIRISESRIAVTLGDVAGKGIATSVLMAVTQGFLHAALSRHGDPAHAARELNAYLEKRCGDGRFITLWIGIIDIAEQALHYLDAGHGYAFLRGGDGTIESLRAGGGPPIGVIADTPYRTSTCRFSPGSAVLVVSDGIIEQDGGDDRGGPIAQFDTRRVHAVLQQPVNEAGDVIEALFAAVDRYAGGRSLADDATAVIIHWP